MGQVASMHFRWANHLATERKVDAYEELFGERPTVYLDGTWRDSKGELVFLNGRRWHPEAVTRSGKLIVQVDGEETLLRPTAESGYSLGCEVA